MLKEILERYGKIIKNFRVKRYGFEGKQIEFVIIFEFVDDSVLFVRDYIFQNFEHKYSNQLAKKEW